MWEWFDDILGGGDGFDFGPPAEWEWTPTTSDGGSFNFDDPGSYYPMPYYPGDDDGGYRPDETGGNTGGGVSGGSGEDNIMDRTGDVGSQLWRILQAGGSQASSLIRSLLSSGGSAASGLIQALTSGGGQGVVNPAMIAAALGTAYNHYRDSDRYTDMAERYASQLDPFGAQRPYYQDRLRALTEDPQKFLENDPGYNSLLRLTVDPAMSKMRAKGYGNSGNILSELTKLSGDVANKYLGEEKNRLLQAGGAQFGPGAAAGLLSTGLQGSINSRNAALGDIFSILGLQNRSSYNNQGTNNGSGTDIWSLISNAIGGVRNGSIPPTMDNEIMPYPMPPGSLPGDPSTMFPDPNSPRGNNGV